MAHGEYINENNQFYCGRFCCRIVSALQLMKIYVWGFRTIWNYIGTKFLYSCGIEGWVLELYKIT